MVVAAADNAVSVLPRTGLRDSAIYDEAWLQALIHAEPSVLPLWEIEPAVREAVTVCRELGLDSGYLDNLLVTPNGDLVLVECKLWRNPQARREVVAQIIDYAKDLKRLDYSAFEAAIAGALGDRNARLYDFVASSAESLDEPDFVDAVARNLRRGRVLLVIAGDGISESVEEIADYLQQHAGIHFTLALVKLAVYALPGGDRLVVPSIPLRTSNVVRGIVRVVDGQAEVTAPPDTPQARRPTTMTEEEFFAGLDARREGTSERLLELVARDEDLGLRIDAKKTLIVRLPLGEDYGNVLVIEREGNADTGYLWWLADRIGDKIIRSHLEQLASAVGGTVRYTRKGGYVRMPDRYLHIWDVLDHGDAWLDAVRQFQTGALEALKA